MTMRSNKVPEIRNGIRFTRSSHSQKRATAEQGDNDASAHRVNFSGKSNELADIIFRVNRLPDVRDALVQELKQQIDAGTYRIDPGQIASAILKHVRHQPEHRDQS